MLTSETFSLGRPAIFPGEETVQRKLHSEMQWPEVDVDVEIEREDEELYEWRHEGRRQVGEPWPSIS